VGYEITSLTKIARILEVELFITKLAEYMIVVLLDDFTK
jgi:hypothetical protein